MCIGGIRSDLLRLGMEREMEMEERIG